MKTSASFEAWSASSSYPAILGEAMETSASFEARSAPLSHPTAKQRTYGSVRGVPGNRYPYRDRYPALHYILESVPP